MIYFQILLSQLKYSNCLFNCLETQKNATAKFKLASSGMSKYVFAFVL